MQFKFNDNYFVVDNLCDSGVFVDYSDLEIFIEDNSDITYTEVQVNKSDYYVVTCYDNEYESVNDAETFAFNSVNDADKFAYQVSGGTGHYEIIKIQHVVNNVVVAVQNNPYA
jgi:hypothetical protein